MSQPWIRHASAFVVLCASLLCTALLSAEPGDKTRVVSVTPEDRATEIDRDAVIQIHFATGLTLRTINAETVRLVDATGRTVPARLGFDLEGDVVTLRALGQLKLQAKYTIDGKTDRPRGDARCGV